MSAILKSTLGTSLAEGIFNEVVSKSSRYYYYLGKNISWTPGSGVETPETPVDDYAYELETRAEIITLKQIKSSDVAYVIPRYDWVSGTVYDIYDDSYTADNPAYSGATKIEEAMMYVVTDVFNVYKCISNNYDKPSTVKPTGTDTTQFQTGDGYIWKFMYTVPIALRNKFLQADFIPVSTALRNRFYSNGEITSVSIDDPGSGYVDGDTTITVQGDGFQEDNPYIISSVTVLTPGSGYTSATGTFSAPVVISGSELQATGTVTISGGQVQSVSVDEDGYGYDDSVTITISEPVAGSVDFEPNSAVILGDKIKVGDNYYEVTSAGNTGPTAPTHTSGAVLNGSAELTFIASQAYAKVNTTKTEAILTPVITGGEITNVIIDNPGVGYTNINLTVVGAGTDAVLSAETSVGNLDTLQSNVELLAVEGSIDFIKVVDQGLNYNSATVVVTGDGLNCQGTAVINQGRVIGVTVTNRGQNYTTASVSIVGDGTGATARAIISPKGGHGKNAVEELYASTLMFFSSISNEKNLGLVVNNDYRQLGIIKNPRKFDDSTNFKEDIGSGCYLLEFNSAVDTVKFLPDMELVAGTKLFKIVSILDNKILVQAPTNSVPAVGEELKNPSLDGITPSLVSNPTVDKYSGSMLFIDNRNAFSATAEQAVSLRTTIQF